MPTAVSITFCTVLCAVTLLAQAPDQSAAAPQPGSPAVTEMPAVSADKSVNVEETTPAATPASNESLFHRWLDLQTMSQADRWRSTAHSGGAHFFENGQERSLIAGRIKLDAQGRYEIGFRISSGHYF